MKAIDEWRVARIRGSRPPASIQLLAGDLSRIPAAHAVDALVVSAFPDNYSPRPGTVIGSLHDRGFDMADVARRKEEDERRRLGCWLSKPLPARLASKFHFKRVICFEPRYPAFVENANLDTATLEDSVSFVFRCLNNFVIRRSSSRALSLSRLAMPLLATGNQGVPLEPLFRSLLEAAVFWLEEGLPVDQLKIVGYADREVAAARKVFAKAKARYRPRQRIAPGSTIVRVRGPRAVRLARNPKTGAPIDVPGARYDIFISYAHKQTADVQEFVRALQQSAPDARVFFDRSSIPAGGQWIRMLSDAVQNARTFVAILSPDYTASLPCWDEFQCAKLMEYNTRRSIVKTVRLYTEQNLPPIMGIYSYIDCAEGDLKKLREAAATIGSG